MSSYDVDILNTVIYYYYFLDLLQMLDMSRHRHIDVKYRNYFDSYIRKVDPRYCYNKLSRVCCLLLLQILEYFNVVVPKHNLNSVSDAIKYFGKEWYEMATKVNDVKGRKGRDGDGVYIMGIVVDKLNTFFEFPAIPGRQLQVLKCIFVNHLFFGPKVLIAGLDSDITRLYHSIFYNYLQVSFYIDNVHEVGDVIDVYLDSCQKAVFCFIESYLDCVGIQKLDSEGYDEPYERVSDERLKVLISSKCKDGLIIPCHVPPKLRLEKYMQMLKNDDKYELSLDLKESIGEYLKYLNVRNAIIHPGFSKWTFTERTLERKYLQTKELILSALNLSKNIWFETFSSELPSYLYRFDFESSIRNSLLDERKYRYYKSKEYQHRSPDLFQ